MTNTMRFVASLVCLVSAGCSSPNVNPSAPRANAGYVDFYTDTSEELSWRVKRTRDQTGEMRTEFLEYKPLPGNILRLAAPAGTHRFEVWFNNLVTTGPQSVLVQVANAKVTPVHVTLAAAGSTSVENKAYEYRPTARATRRVTRIVTDQEQTFRIDLTAGTPEVYRPKEQMPYWSSTAR